MSPCRHRMIYIWMSPDFYHLFLIAIPYQSPNHILILVVVTDSMAAPWDHVFVSLLEPCSLSPWHLDCIRNWYSILLSYLINPISM